MIQVNGLLAAKQLQQGGDALNDRLSLANISVVEGDESASGTSSAEGVSSSPTQELLGLVAGLKRRQSLDELAVEATESVAAMDAQAYDAAESTVTLLPPAFANESRPQVSNDQEKHV